MTETPNCARCGQIESNKHLLFECKSSSEMWESYNKVMNNTSDDFKQIKSFDDIFDFGGNALVNIVKIKLIQETIQITRPTYWCQGRVENITKEQKELNHLNN